MMKRIFAMLLALLLVFSLVACSKEEDEDEDGIDLTVTDNGQYYNAGGTYNDRFAFEVINGNEIAITGFESDYDPHDIVVPAVIEGCPVVEISDMAFYYCSQLKVVTLPTTVTRIGKMAFAGCAQLTAVQYANNDSTLVTVDEYAFAYCGSLQTITLPETVSTIGTAAFFDCVALTQANIPEGIELPEMVFFGCTNLTR